MNPSNSLHTHIHTPTYQLTSVGKGESPQSEMQHSIGMVPSLTTREKFILQKVLSTSPLTHGQYT